MEVQKGVRREMSEKILKLMMTALVLVLAALPALAESDARAPRVHDYNFLDVAYLYQEIDIENRHETAHGFGVSGGIQLYDWLSLWASSSAAMMETEYVNVTTAIIGIGIGAHTPVSDTVSVYANLGYLTAEVEAEWAVDRDVSASVTTDGSGYSLGTGMRALVLPRLELSVGVSLVSIEDGSDSSFGGGLEYSLTDKVALGAVVSVADDVVGAAFGTRFYFK